MTDPSKIKLSHTQRAAYVYIRQSTPGQVEHHRESTTRQYALADRACQLGWAKEQVVIVDEDLGLSGSSTDKRSGFARLTSEVALAHVGIVLGLEVSRLARNNADWYRLLELCGVTDTLIGDNDGVYHPALFNDRLLLGLKGTMSEAELHIIRARLDGGIRNKAARGELRRGLPVGLVWGDQDGEVLFHPDEAVTGAIRTVFERFAEFGSARRVWLWFRSEGLSFPLQTVPAGMPGPIRWLPPTYHALHQVLTNPVYASAYTYGKTRFECYVDEPRRRQETDSASAHGTVGRSHPGPLSRFYRLGYVSGQSGAARFQHAAQTAPGRRRRERGLGIIARHRYLWPLRPEIDDALSRPELDARLPLRGQRSRQRPRRVLPQHRWPGDRASSIQCFSGGHHAGND
jgi:DNA invertase Pin-like site-specific DNA recombinase